MAKECLADFTLRLRDKGVSEDAINEITNRLVHDRVEAMAAAAAAYNLHTPITRFTFADQLSAMSRRCHGLSAAITGAADETLSRGCVIFDGLNQLIMDLTDFAERLEQDYQCLMSDIGKETSKQ